MDIIFCKMNEENYLIVDSKLKDKNRDPVDFEPSTIFDWIDNATKFNHSVAALSKNSRQERKTIRNKIIKSKTSTLRV